MELMIHEKGCYWVQRLELTLKGCYSVPHLGLNSEWASFAWFPFLTE
jgi:hypothetical protein